MCVCMCVCWCQLSAWENFTWYFVQASSDSVYVSATRAVTSDSIILPSTCVSHLQMSLSVLEHGCLLVHARILFSVGLFLPLCCYCIQLLPPVVEKHQLGVDLLQLCAQRICDHFQSHFTSQQQLDMLAGLTPAITSWIKPQVRILHSTLHPTKPSEVLIHEEMPGQGKKR